MRCDLICMISAMRCLSVQSARLLYTKTAVPLYSEPTSFHITRDYSCIVEGVCVIIPDIVILYFLRSVIQVKYL